jgi:tRNA threonylcarbamoyladenosine biosynthesis protein TsaB
MILGIDTSGKNFGLALAAEGQIKFSALSQPGLKHGEILQNSVMQFLGDSQTDFQSLRGVAVTLGPGSFTGLRIGLAAAKGYAYGLKLPLTGISTLLAIAGAYSKVDNKVVSIIDAKRNEIYWAAFDCSGNEPIRLSPDSVDPIDSLDELAEEKAIFIGPKHLQQLFIDRYPNCDYRPNDEFNLAIPAAIYGEKDISLNKKLDVATIVPTYLRS